ncbi:endonuclease dU [Methanocaldococcus sp.]
MKDEVEVIGFDDTPFNKEDRYCLLTSVYMRGNKIVDGVYFKKIKKDGLDVTDKIIEVVRGKHYNKIKAIFLYGITFAGFNIADIYKIYNETEKPVIVVIDKYPNFNKIFKALKNFEDCKVRENIIKKLPKPEKIEDLYIQSVGIEKEKIDLLIKKCRLKSKVPECLRLAHLIGRGFLYL